MTPITTLAQELKLTTVSLSMHCRSREIVTHRRLPAGARGGQLVAHVTDKDARRIREHYQDRLASLKG